MSAPKKGNRKFQIQLEEPVIEGLKKAAKPLGELSANALAARWIREKLLEFEREGNQKSADPLEVKSQESSLASLLMEAHKSIAELSKTIVALSAKGDAVQTPSPTVTTVGPRRITGEVKVTR